MYFSLEILEAFTQAAEQGSFSAAARKLGKSQSTISEAVSRLEIDLGVKLFDRRGREPVLTEAGVKLLSYAKNIFRASDQLNKVAYQLSSGIEPRVTLALSDTYQSQKYTDFLKNLDQQYPELEFECIVAEHDDVLNLVRAGRANLGLLITQPQYTPEIAHLTIPQYARFGLFVARTHPLAGYKKVTYKELAEYRLIYIKTAADLEVPHHLFDIINPTHYWAGSNYMLVLEMVVGGFGWAELPYEMVKAFAEKDLVELEVTGWPYSMTIDVIWSRKRKLGQASSWLLNALTQA